MSYTSAAPLQEAIFTTLSNDAALSALVGSAIYDVVPTGTLPALYVSLGPDDVRDASDQSGQGAEHDISISVIASDSGFHTAKTVAAAICDALTDVSQPMNRGRLVSFSFRKAKAVRDQASGQRRIDLSFRARTEDE